MEMDRRNNRYNIQYLTTGKERLVTPVKREERKYRFYFLPQSKLFILNNTRSITVFTLYEDILINKKTKHGVSSQIHHRRHQAFQL